MPSKPIIYCCVPRPGIMFMSLVFGCLGLISSILAQFSSDFFHIKSFTDFIKCINGTGIIISTIAFFYSGYLAYKRRYNPFKYLLYIFWADILSDAFNGVISLKDAFDMLSHEHDVRTEQPYNATENNHMTEDEYYKMQEALTYGVHVIMPIVITFFTLFSLLNKIYFIIKMKSYVDYVTYKKEEARPVPVVELPHKLPECSQ